MKTENFKLHSHRKYIKQKTNELIQYHHLPGKRSSVNLKNNINHTRADAENQHETSIVVENLDPLETSLNRKINPMKFEIKRNHIKSQQNLIKRFNKKRASLGKINSVQFLTPMVETPSKINKNSCSFKIVSRFHKSLEKNKSYGSSDAIENTVKQKKNYFDPLKIKSDNNLRSTLKKGSTSKLKIKVKDPFLRKMKLDNQFNNQSDIMKNQEQSLLSTLNHCQFEDILSQLL